MFSFVTSIFGVIIAIISTQIMLALVFRRLYFAKQNDAQSVENESMNSRVNTKKSKQIINKPIYYYYYLSM